MKYINLSGKAALAALVGGALFASSALADDKDDATETRDLAPFSKIVIKGSADANVTVGQSQDVQVTTESDYLSRVETEVRGDTLYISQEGRHWRNVNVKLTISVQDLDGVTVKGSGDFDITNLDSESFDILIEGSGDVDVSGDSSSFDVEINGSGDVDMAGECNSMDIEINGSGDVEASGLSCADVDLSIDGSGDVDVYASSSLLVKMQGSGDVTVYGDPDRFRPTMRGSGNVRFVDK